MELVSKKSPTLVLSSTASSNSKSKSKKRSTSPSKHEKNSWALSLHVVKLDLGKEQEAMPLDFNGPTARELDSTETTPPRRSSRFTKNKYKSVSPGRGLQIALISPRRSSRFTKNRYKTATPERFRGGPHAALPLSTARTSSRQSWWLDLSVGSKKRRHIEEEQSELSRSGGGLAREKVNVPMRSHQGIGLRKSPRLNSNLDKAKDGNSKSDFLALPGPSLCNSSASHLRRRSPRLNSNSLGVKNGNHENVMVALPDMISEQKSVLRKCSSSGKSSLCRTAPMELEDGRKKMARNDSGSRNPSNVGEKLLIARKIESELSKTPNGSTSPRLGRDNATHKFLRSRKVEFQSPGSGVQENGGNVGDKCVRYRKSTVSTGTSMQCDHDNAGGSCLGSRTLEIECLGDSYSGSQHMNVSEKLSKSEKIELQSMGKVTLESNDIEQRDLGSVENRLLPDEKELDIGDQPVGKCESDVSVEKCLRTQNVAAGEHAAKPSAIVYGRNSRSGASAIKSKKSGRKERENTTVSFFIGEPFTEEEAVKRWEWRYKLKSSKSKRNGAILNAGEEDETILNVEFHYAQASIEGSILSIGDCALIQGEGKENHIGRILEFFKTMDGEDYFRVQWFYRAEDTVMKESATCHDKKRIFYSTLKNDNPLDCIVSRVSVTQVPSAVSLKQDTIPATDFYYDMEYCVEYSTFRNLQLGDTLESQDPVPHEPGDVFHQPITATPLAVLSSCESFKADLALLDLYSGCGGMSTGLSLGAKLCGINLVTRWAVDFDKAATESLKLNHPETQVRNETAQDFLELLKSWEKLCQSYVFSSLEKIPEVKLDDEIDGEIPADFDSNKDEDPDEEFEVSRLVDVCHGDPNETGKSGLHFKVRWKGYGPDEDTWEPIEGLSNCKERIDDFVRNGLRLKILPLPGDVDVICGGPPCQGISGYNRYRNTDAPLTDEKNHQIVVFMDIVEFLKPKYVLMENVTDILKFGGAFLGRYALSRLVYMKYQARLGTIAAGCYGLPQFRLRVFLWGAISSEKLPPFPLPTHEVVVKYWPPLEFEKNTVAYDEGQPRKLQDAAILSDAISDLPAITSQQKQEEMPYGMPPVTEFQKYIRLTKEEMMGFTYPQSTATKELLLYDHRSSAFSEDNCIRVSQVPRRKGANFRDLPGVIVDDNVARRDPNMEPARLPSGELLIPDCVFTFEKGRSRRPLARLWWDETVATVLTFPNFLSQTILHPDQDRVLSIRECARLQGFPDYYRFCGTVKERYCQIGNAVAIPVGRALGYALGMAYQKLTDDEPLMTLPPNFAFQVPSNDEIVVLRN